MQPEITVLSHSVLICSERINLTDSIAVAEAIVVVPARPQPHQKVGTPAYNLHTLKYSTYLANLELLTHSEGKYLKQLALIGSINTSGNSWHTFLKYCSIWQILKSFHILKQLAHQHNLHTLRHLAHPDQLAHFQTVLNKWVLLAPTEAKK
jgi:hypothetical protein